MILGMLVYLVPEQKALMVCDDDDGGQELGLARAVAWLCFRGSLFPRFDCLGRHQLIKPRKARWTCTSFSDIIAVQPITQSVFLFRILDFSFPA